MKPVALFLFGYGSEVRQFIYSGFIDELTEYYRVVVAARVVNENLKELSQRHGFELTELIHSEPNTLQKFLFGKADAVFFRAYHYKRKFSYFGGTSKADVPVRFPAIFQWLLPWVNHLERVAFTLLRDRSIDRFLADVKPSLVIVNLPRSPYFLRSLFQSKQHGAKNILVFNTLKEIDANGRLNVPVDFYFTWNSESSMELLQFNRQIDRRNVHAVGSPYYDRSQSQNVAKCSKHLLYCAANPKSIPNEVAFVERLVYSFKVAGLLDKLTFIIRPNPMDDDFSRWNALAQVAGVKVEVPRWTWRGDENWNEALMDDVETYQRLLQQARFVIGSASTVAIDSVIAGKPFLCIADNFWPDTIGGCDFSYFAEAANFKVARQSRAVFCAKTFDEMARTLRTEGDPEFSPADMPAVVYDAARTAGQKIVEELLKGQAPCRTHAD